MESRTTHGLNGEWGSGRAAQTPMSAGHAYHEVPCVYVAQHDVRTVLVGGGASGRHEAATPTTPAAAAGGRFAVAGEGSGVGAGGRLFTWQRCAAQPHVLELHEAATHEARVRLSFAAPVLRVAAAEADGDTVARRCNSDADEPALEWFVLYVSLSSLAPQPARSSLSPHPWFTDTCSPPTTRCTCSRCVCREAGPRHWRR